LTTALKMEEIRVLGLPKFSKKFFQRCWKAEVGRNSQRCWKSEESEIETGSKVGTRKSEIKIFFRKSEG